MKYTPLEYDEYKQYLIEYNNVYCGGRWLFEFINGYGVSVIKHNASYGNERDLFEIAVIKDGEIEGDVTGYLSNQEVLDILQKVMNRKWI